MPFWEKVNWALKVSVASNPYSNGVLMSSSNGSSWTMHQSSDLKFNLYRCVFEEDCIVEFEDINEGSSTYSGASLLVSMYTPSACSVGYEYALGSETLSSDAKPFSRSQALDFDSVQSIFKIRANIKATSWLSPILYGDNQSLILEDREISGAYVTRNIKFESTDKYKVIKIIVDISLPSGCSVSPQYLKDVTDSTSWTAIPASDPATAYYDGDYYTYYYYKDVTEEAGDELGLADFKFKLAMVAGSKVNNIKIKRLRILLEDSPIEE